MLSLLQLSGKLRVSKLIVLQSVYVSAMVVGNSLGFDEIARTLKPADQHVCKKHTQINDLFMWSKVSSSYCWTITNILNVFWCKVRAKCKQCNDYDYMYSRTKIEPTILRLLAKYLIQVFVGVLTNAKKVSVSFVFNSNALHSLYWETT